MADPDASSHQLMYDAIAHAERLLVETFEGDVGYELDIADRAEALLALVMSSVGSWTGTVRVDDDGAPVGEIGKLILGRSIGLTAPDRRTARAPPIDGASRRHSVTGPTQRFPARASCDR